MNDHQRKRLTDTNEPDRSTHPSTDLTWLAISDTDDDESDYREKGSFGGDRHELNDK